ncbi:DUF2637 domain-containing protein [Streptomyces sp. NPDC059256]|uniref:DUF2637 domain-containing protein n=1 Tax=Streptomyces sp. NPDC059256 TaxID=3346794 RepID=UPI0036CC3D2D
MPKRARSVRVDAVLVQAVIAGSLSFSHLHDLAAAAGQSGWKAWAYPVSVDLLLVAAWRRMRELQRAGQPASGPRLWFLIALAASLGANVATAGLLDLNDVPASLSVVVAGWPAVAFFGGTLLAHTSAPAPEEETPTQSLNGSDDQKDPLPALSTVEETTDVAAPPAPVSASTVPLPPALIEQALRLAAEQRAATGRPADPDSVRLRLGLPPSMTASVAAHL